MTAILATFFAAFVEAVEALTIVLAVARTRGLAPALAGTAAALAALAAAVALGGTLLGGVPIRLLKVVTGIVLVLFGARWLRKAVLRAAGRLPLRDEDAAFERTRASLAGAHVAGAAVAAQAVAIEGAEIVLIVLAARAGGAASLRKAVIAAAAATLAVAALGIALGKPLARIPENTLKFGAGLVLFTLGLAWTVEALAPTYAPNSLGLLFCNTLLALCVTRALTRTPA